MPALIKRAPLLVIISLVLSCQGPERQSDSTAVRLSIEMAGAHRDNNRIETVVSDTLTLIEVNSPDGIGRATIRRADGKWPEMVFRLHLTGLESFFIDNGDVIVTTAVASQMPHNVSCRVQNKDTSREQTVTPDHPLWLRTLMVAADEDMQAIPLADGYFEIAVPRALFDHNPEMIEISWVDFWRH